MTDGPVSAARRDARGLPDSGFDRGADRGVDRPPGGFTAEELERWSRENPEAVRRLAGMPLSDEGLRREVEREISRARAGWQQRTRAAEDRRSSGPPPVRVPEIRPTRPLEPGEVQLLGPDGVLYTLSEQTYAWLQEQQRRAVAAEFIETAAAALAGMPRRGPTAGPPPRPPITDLDRSLAAPAPARTRPALAPAPAGGAATRPGTAPAPVRAAVPPTPERPPVRVPSTAPATPPPTAAPPAIPAPPPPPGMSRNEMLEGRSRDAHYPTADLANAKQPAIDLVDGGRTDAWAQTRTRAGQLAVTRTTTGGRWIQLKRLAAEGTTRTSTEQRIRTELRRALVAFDDVLDRRGGVSAVTNTLDDGTRLTQTYRTPATLHVALEVEGLTPERAATLQRVAESELRRHTEGFGSADRVMGVPVTVSVRPTP